MTSNARDDEVAAAVHEVAARLQQRGIAVDDTERPGQLADLLTAVERFESEVESLGGDLMVDEVGSTEPDDPHFVLPQRKPNEDLHSYVSRIDQARQRLRDHPPLPGA
jgi:hypothetical protein